MNKSTTEIFINGLRSKRVDVHGSTGNEMFYPALDLRWTSSIVRTIMCGFALISHKFGATLGAMGYKLNRLRPWLTTVGVDAHNLRNDLATLLHIHIIADVKIEAAYEIFVVKRGATHRGASKLHRLHVGNGRHGSCTANLIGDLVKAREGAFSFKLIGYSPSRTLCSEAQLSLLS